MKEEKELAAILCHQLAQREMSDATVTSIAKQLVAVGQLPKRLDICTYGICGDYYIDRGRFVRLFEELQRAFDVRKLEVFTNGIPVPDAYHVRFEASLHR